MPISKAWSTGELTATISRAFSPMPSKSKHFADHCRQIGHHIGRGDEDVPAAGGGPLTGTNMGIGQGTSTTVASEPVVARYLRGLILGECSKLEVYDAIPRKGVVPDSNPPTAGERWAVRTALYGTLEASCPCDPDRVNADHVAGVISRSRAFVLGLAKEIIKHERKSPERNL